ncbi:membrane protein [Streptomyces zagrosensis]|uniref:Membrane protein n=1 Tax=Streptomyces zagrosensis TaxID=1042984 RepID=A0A7W9UYN0_9ACTN|nr:membrane protein [Streptomyces zagrosensis]
MAWLLLKDTVNSCMEYRVTGLAAEAAFFTLLSLPPLLLGLIGLLGYLDAWTNTETVASIRDNILEASGTVLSDKGVSEIAEPLLDDVIEGGRPDVISLGFAIALWSGSRAVNVFVDTITIMYGLEGHRGIVKTRLLAFLLYLVALMVGAVALPLMVVGPDAVVHIFPRSADTVRILYWPVVILLSVAFLTTLYHVSVPVRSPWREDIPGALIALTMWVLGSLLLRIYLTQTVEGPTIYGSLAAPVAVLLWIGVSAFAVLVGAAVNASLDRVWPSVATAAAREERERERRAAAARAFAEAAARERDAEGDDWAESEPPSEFPERWAQFLPPKDVRSRLHARREREHVPERDRERAQGRERERTQGGAGAHAQDQQRDRQRAHARADDPARGDAAAHRGPGPGATPQGVTRYPPRPSYPPGHFPRSTHPPAPQPPPPSPRPAGPARQQPPHPSDAWEPSSTADAPAPSDPPYPTGAAYPSDAPDGAYPPNTAWPPQGSPEPPQGRNRTPHSLRGRHRAGP